MIPARHPNATRTLTAPDNWNPEKPCGSLPISDTHIDGLHFMESVWEPTPAERAAIAVGEKVVLAIQGQSHPVVRLGVTVGGPDPDMTSLERHNFLAPELVYRVLNETKDEPEALLIMESIMLGVMLRYRPKSARAAQLLLDEVNHRVIKRIGPGPSSR